MNPMNLGLGGAVAGTIIFAILIGVVSQVENQALKIILTVIFYIAMTGFGLIAIIRTAQMVWGAF